VEYLLMAGRKPIAVAQLPYPLWLESMRVRYGVASANQLAKRAGLNPSTLSKHLAGQKPDRESIEKIIAALDLPKEDAHRGLILGGFVPEGSTVVVVDDAATERLFGVFETLPPGSKRVVLRVAEEMGAYECATTPRSAPLNPVDDAESRWIEVRPGHFVEQRIRAGTDDQPIMPSMVSDSFYRQLRALGLVRDAEGKPLAPLAGDEQGGIVGGE
jgi:hypothetical protein